VIEMGKINKEELREILSQQVSMNQLFELRNLLYLRSVKPSCEEVINDILNNNDERIEQALKDVLGWEFVVIEKM